MSDEMEAAWKPIKETLGRYEISNFGFVRNAKTLHVRNIAVLRNGYASIYLKTNGVGRNFLIHRLVASAFISSPPFRDAQCNHIDFNKLNNCVGNLEWVSASENQRHTIASGRKNMPRGECSPHAKLTCKTVLRARSLHGCGHSIASLAKKFLVSEMTISDAIKRRTWAHV